MLGDEEDYKRRFEELNKKLNDEKVSEAIDECLRKISEMTNCDVELKFNVLPFKEDYSERQESEDYKMPDYPTMQLSQLVTHLNDKHNQEFDVYIDPIYLKEGVNEIVDVLMTTIDRKVIIVPISNKKEVKL